MALRPVALLAAAVAALAATAATAAAEPECPPMRPRVAVALDDPDPSFDASLGMEALRAEAAAPSSAAHQHLGVTTFRVEWRSEVEARVVTAGGRVCARPERVSLTIRHVEHSVRIARELPRGGCLFRQTEAHEQRHVAVNRATLRRAAAEVEAKVRSWAVTAVGRGPTEQAAAEALRADLRRAITPAMEAMQEVRDAAHRRIDRPEEYRRLGRVCPSDQKLLRERLRGRMAAASAAD
jgi:hypothetical protein